MHDKRNSPRLSWQGKVIVSDLKSGRLVSNDTRMRNIGRRGFSFLTEDSLVRGMHYRFRIVLMGVEVECIGRVVHLLNESTYYYGGVQLTEISWFNRARLNRFLSSHSKKIQNRQAVYSVLSGLMAAGLLHFVIGVSFVFSILAFLLTIATLLVFPPY